MSLLEHLDMRERCTGIGRTRPASAWTDASEWKSTAFFVDGVEVRWTENKNGSKTLTGPPQLVQSLLAGLE